MKTTEYSKVEFFQFAIIVLTGFFTFLSVWAVHRFGHLNFDSVITTLYYPMGSYTNGVYKSLVKWVGLPAPFILLAPFMYHGLAKKFQLNEKILKYLAIIAGLVVIVWLLFWLNYTQLNEYFKEATKYTNLYEKEFIAPSSTTVSFQNQKRNIIHIYLESFECAGYDSNNNYYSTSNIPHLSKLAQENFSITPLNKSIMHTLYTTGCTTNAIVAQTTGSGVTIPANALFSTRKTFFSHATTLGEMLKDNGYATEFVMGSDADFGNRSNYLSNSKIAYLDYKKMREQHLIPQNYQENWGIEDRKLFNITKSEISKLAKSSRPFALGVLTTDTHTPGGYTCPLCDTSIKDPYKRAINCSDKQVAEFVSWIKQQDFYENTTIVISGDHTSMDPTVNNSLNAQQQAQRSVYFTIINPAKSADTKANFSHRNASSFDVFPTILDAAGATLPQKSLGFGKSLFTGEKTLIEKYGETYLNAQLSRQSQYYRKYLF